MLKLTRKEFFLRILAAVGFISLPVPVVKAATPLTATGTLVANDYFRKRALDKLQRKFQFRDACMRDTFPQHSGKTVQWYKYGDPRNSESVGYKLGVYGPKETV